MPSDPDGPASPARSTALLMALPLLAIAAGLAGLALGGGGVAAWFFGAVALLSSALLALCVGYQLARSRFVEPLREARGTAQAYGQLVDAWVWQTDREHRLVRLQPPHGAPASSWAGQGASGQPLWERFEDESGELRERLAAQAPLQGLATRRPGPAPGARWLLRGVPRFDGQGRFAGYLGLARPTDLDDARRLDQQCLAALWAAGPQAMCLISREPLADTVAGAAAGPAAQAAAQASPAAAPWRLQRANPAARRLLGLADGEPLPHWQAALEGGPPALRAALARPDAGRVEVPEGWSVAVAEVDGAPALRLVSFMPAAADEGLQALAAEHAAFSYTVSHDLRAPIRVVEGFARILKEDYGRVLDRIGNDHVDRVLAAAARMNHMIDALLSLSRLSTQPLARQRVDLSQLAGFVVDDLRRGSPERPVEVAIEPGLAASGDPTLLRMALENLLGNAWKYTGRQPQPAIRFERGTHEGRTVFVVADNGAGFDMRFADRLFGVFQRLHGHNDFPGSGVGLASVRRIVRRHGGDIWAESEVGRGARFYFTLGG